ncbi:MAG: class I SAM-dependent methyltransferase [Paludibacteraceae bacterium]|nr:class I SAM-dependent methyltransferase [Paludibacteraceae bacterium]
MKCKVCNSNKTHLKYTVDRGDLRKGLSYKIIECEECGFCYADGLFNTKLLEDIYNDHFYLTSQQNSYYSNSPILINAKDRADNLKKIITSGSLLDVGAGKGYFVECVSSYMKAEGIDLSDFAVEEARKDGRNVYYGDFLNYNFNKAFDVVTMWDVFACFPDSVAVVKKVRQVLNDHGIYIFTLPMIDSWLSKIFKSRWPLMIPPTNMVYFTPKSVRVLLEQNGFKLKNMVYETKWISLDFIIRKFLKSIKLFSLANKKLPIPKKLKIPFKSKDILTVTAEKS